MSTLTNWTGWDREMQAALEADGEKLRQLTGEDHGPFDYEPDYNTYIAETESLEEAMADVATYDDWFPPLPASTHVAAGA